MKTRKFDRPYGHNGFSLIEILIVLTIIAILVGFLIAGVMRARQTAGQTECRNNLRQIALGMQNYVSTNSAFPPGNVIPNVCCETNNSPSKENWAICILPFIDQQHLYSKYQPDKFCEEQAEEFRTAFVKTYACPSDPSVLSPGIPATGHGRELSFMPSSYRGMSGRGSDDGDRFFSQPQEAYALKQAGLWSRRGVLHTSYLSDGKEMFKAGSEKPSDITDGLSSTILVGEYTTTTAPNRRAFWAYSYIQYSLGAATPYSETIGASYLACKTSPNRTFDDDACKHGWGSLHSGGLYFALCDGSAQYFSNAMDMEIFCHMATIANGEVIPHTR